MMEMVMVTYSWGSTPARQRGEGGVMATPTGPQRAAVQGEVPAGALVNFAEGAAPAGTGRGSERSKGQIYLPPGAQTRRAAGWPGSRAG